MPCEGRAYDGKAAGMQAKKRGRGMDAKEPPGEEITPKVPGHVRHPDPLGGGTLTA